MNQFPDVSGMAQWPDIEDLMCTYLDRFGGVPGKSVVTVYPEPDANYEALLPIIFVRRQPGGGSRDGVHDICPVQLEIIGSTRAQSWQVASLVRNAIKAAEHEVVIDGVHVDLHEDSGPNALATFPQTGDQRAVVIAAEARTQRPRN